MFFLVLCIDLAICRHVMKIELWNSNILLSGTSRDKIAPFGRLWYNMVVQSVMIIPSPKNQDFTAIVDTDHWFPPMFSLSIKFFKYACKCNA